MQHEYITQAQATKLAIAAMQPDRKGGTCIMIGPEDLAVAMNAAIQHYIDSQPKPASVEEIKSLVEQLLEPMEGFPQPSALETLAATTLTQQAEALAQALAEVERLKYEVDSIPAIKEERDQLRAEVEKWKAVHEVKTDTLNAMQAELEQLNDRLAALQYDGELPEPVGFMWQHDETGRVGFAEMSQIEMWEKGNPRLNIVGKIYTADQLRQAIADDRTRQQDYLQDIAAFIGVGGYNGATTEQIVERIKAEFQRLNDALAKQVPQWLPIETAPTSEDAPFMVFVPRDSIGDGVAVQVSMFEGRLYPDGKDSCIDWDDAITCATHWATRLETPITKAAK